MEHKLDGDKVTWAGPRHLSWVHLVNQLTIAQCIAVIDSVRTSPYPCGTGFDVYASAEDSADFAEATVGGRDALLQHGHTSDVRETSCYIFNWLDAQAYKRKHSQLGYARLYIAERCKGKHNGPWDSYVRVALDLIKAY